MDRHVKKCRLQTYAARVGSTEARLNVSEHLIEHLAVRFVSNLYYSYSQGITLD